jgi:hemerythrin-like domain-containing protein
MADEPDLVDVLVADHAELGSMLEAFSVTPPGVDESDRLAITIAELVRHLVVEEDYLYPTVREVVPDATPLVEEELTRSATVERLAKQIEASPPGDGHRDALFSRFSDLVRRHVRTTEAELFPRLRQHATPGDLRRLAGQVELAKTTAPTRPHPRAPRTPPWNQILTPGIGLVDRVRDAMTGRPNRPERF